MRPANYAPIYCALYPELAEIARAFGYALSVHGSLARDFDIVCIPWAENIESPGKVIDAICKEFDIHKVGELTLKPHGRTCQTLSISHGECFLDLSFIGPCAWRFAAVVTHPNGRVSTLFAPEVCTGVEETRKLMNGWYPDYTVDRVLVTNGGTEFVVWEAERAAT